MLSLAHVLYDGFAALNFLLSVMAWILFTWNLSSFVHALSWEEDLWEFCLVVGCVLGIFAIFDDCFWLCAKKWLTDLSLQR